MPDADHPTSSPVPTDYASMKPSRIASVRGKKWNLIDVDDLQFVVAVMPPHRWTGEASQRHPLVNAPSQSLIERGGTTLFPFFDDAGMQISVGIRNLGAAVPAVSSLALSWDATTLVLGDCLHFTFFFTAKQTAGPQRK